MLRATSCADLPRLRCALGAQVAACCSKGLKTSPRDTFSFAKAHSKFAISTSESVPIGGEGGAQIRGALHRRRPKKAEMEVTRRQEVLGPIQQLSGSIQESRDPRTVWLPDDSGG